MSHLACLVGDSMVGLAIWSTGSFSRGPLDNVGWPIAIHINIKNK